MSLRTPGPAGDTHRLHSRPDEPWSVELRRRDRFRYMLDHQEIHPATGAPRHGGYHCSDCVNCVEGGIGHQCVQGGKPHHTLARWPGCHLIELRSGERVRTAADVPAMLAEIRRAEAS